MWTVRDNARLRLKPSLLASRRARSQHFQNTMAPTQQIAAAALAAAGCTAFVAAPSTARLPALRSSAQAQAAQAAQTKASASTGLALCGLGAAVGAAVAAPRKERAALRAFENELGVQAPLGFWDPAGFTSDGDAQEFYRRRVVEIKHGRVSMLACTGYIVQEFVRFPGFLSPSTDLKFADVPSLGCRVLFLPRLCDKNEEEIQIWGTVLRGSASTSNMPSQCTTRGP